MSIILDFRANSREQNKTGKFVLHCMQLKPKMGCKTLEFHRMFNVNSNAEIVHSFPCKVNIFYLKSKTPICAGCKTIYLSMDRVELCSK